MSTKSDIKMHKQILLSISLLEFEALIRSVFQGELEKHLRTPVKASTDYISAKEAAGILKISVPTLRKYRREEVVKGYRLGHNIRFKRNEVEKAFLSMSTIKYSRTSI
jgi:excisionase family DNA binding protein